tara:strand:- start:321 stop:800 length:480 start_codon:yes stop_codon:yes gene_type:complete
MRSIFTATVFSLTILCLNGCSGTLDEKDNDALTSIGGAFLEENSSRPNVVTTSSGLQYVVLKEGSGIKPSSSSTVVTHYKGELVDGTVFDSSRKRGAPATFAVGGVIKGWTEALQLMREGSHWRLFIPSELAYGSGGAGGGLIPPNAILIFDIELLEVR